MNDKVRHSVTVKLDYSQEPLQGPHRSQGLTQVLPNLLIYYLSFGSGSHVEKSIRVVWKAYEDRLSLVMS